MKVLAPLLVLLLALPAAADTVRLKTTDGVRLSAQWDAPRKLKGAVIALHDRGKDRTSWAPLTADALKAGLGVLTVDLRGHGDSKRPKQATTDAALVAGMHHDVAAALTWLKRRHKLGPDKVMVFGAGLGAALALEAGARHPKLKAAVVLSPPATVEGLDVPAQMKAWAGRPLLLVAAMTDADEGATALYDAVPAPKEAVLLKVPQKDVAGTGMFGPVKGLAERLVEWAVRRLD